MIQKIKSYVVELPPIYLVENEEDWKKLPKGLPYIIGNSTELDFITVFLEFQVLYKSCLNTNMSIKWLDCLKKLGYYNLKNYKISSGGSYWEPDTGEGPSITINDFVEDNYIVNFDRLSELKILPKWFENLKESVTVNLIEEVEFDPTAFNKKLGLNTGSPVIKRHKKNLLILDCSNSIPDSIVKTITLLGKVMSRKFYCDIIITCGKSYFIDYEDVLNTDIVELARKGGRNNEGEMFNEIMKLQKDYNVCISFGDDDSPERHRGINKINNNFTIDTLYSLHTENNSDNITGYAKHFKPLTTHIVKDWVNTIE